MRLSIGDQGIRAGEIVDTGGGVHKAKLHFVLRLELTVFCPQGRNILRVTEIRRIGCGTNFDAVDGGDLTEGLRRRSVYDGVAAASAGEHESEQYERGSAAQS